VGAQLSSSAVNLALGCNRPIIITDTNWFNDIKTFPGVYICDTRETVRSMLLDLTGQENTKLIEDELTSRTEIIKTSRRTFENFVAKHQEIYQKFGA
jgi:hypothetical protein